MALTPRLPRPSSPPPAAPVARRTSSSAAEANEAIRALVDARAGEDWSSVESAAYEVLLIEWAAATQALGSDITEAA
ncbi:hypothetical protein [Streptomyces fulvorobeus]|uniref:Uncharacterized protein n=1 Tax=Streptomyces fulvorobeus TaxID=284028 RepID=A0A7Y9HG80_9ACTN|nr:hypothetical protein [Streptomyces fulvorobeus]NYE43666.1 hypothetical protein [Streptomyces fulvorobeus]